MAKMKKFTPVVSSNSAATAYPGAETTTAPETAKELTESQPNQIEMLKEMGIPVKMAVFHKTVLSLASNTPEYAFYQDGKKSRTAKMWYTPTGLLTEQGGRYKLIPLANIADTELIHDT